MCSIASVEAEEIVDYAYRLAKARLPIFPDWITPEIWHEALSGKDWYELLDDERNRRGFAFYDGDDLHIVAESGYCAIQAIRHLIRVGLRRHSKVTARIRQGNDRVIRLARRMGFVVKSENDNEVILECSATSKG